MAGKYKRKARKASTDVVAVLKRARALVKRGWCQGALSRDKSGIHCGEMDPHAKCWCVLGATYRATGSFDVCDDVWNALEKVARTRDLAGWNDRDRRTQSQAVSLFTKAIAEAEAER